MTTLPRVVIDYQALTLFCVDYTGKTPKISNLLEDLKKVERFAQYIENQASGNMTETEGSQKQYAFMEDNRYI